MGRAMLSKSLIQFSVDGWSCVPFLLLDLRPNYGGSNEDNGESESEVAYPTLCDPMDCSLPVSSVHGIFQARVLEWVAIPFSNGPHSVRPLHQEPSISLLSLSIRGQRE